VKIAVLVSGGVDSSLAAHLLKEQGHEITAFYLKIWLEDELSFLGSCPWLEDLEYVKKLCAQLDIPLTEVSLQKEYWEAIVGYTIAEARAGRNPNPDVLCNSRIKFGCFFDYIDASFDKVATGHYAQVIQVNGQFELHCSPDPVKDQTYFLAHLNQAQLARIMFPIGHLSKKKVRAMAHERNVPSKDRQDSQGLCFLGKVKFTEFLKFHLGEQPGDFVEFKTGKVVGKHQGFWFYTVGQRKGMGLSGGPWYVVKKDLARNLVFISKEAYSKDKPREIEELEPFYWYYSKEIPRDMVELEAFHWITQTPQAANLEVKLRHGPERNQAQLVLKTSTGQAFLAHRDQGIAPGQFAVFYSNNLCLGCARIAVPTAAI
jgi:tRNA-specific 2-thiouridylase